jgi:predicted secreted Zn-dependent protease
LTLEVSDKRQKVATLSTAHGRVHESPGLYESHAAQKIRHAQIVPQRIQPRVAVDPHCRKSRSRLSGKLERVKRFIRSAERGVDRGKAEGSA